MKELNESHIKILKHFSNGITHNLILWIISKGPIHGYGIMKKVDDFFDFGNENRKALVKILREAGFDPEKYSFIKVANNSANFTILK